MPRTSPSAIPRVDPPGNQPLLIDDVFRLLTAEGWRLIGHVPGPAGGVLWIRRRNENDFHEKPVEFVLNEATLADVPQLPTLAEFQQAAPDAEQGNG
jgi:hypothetical protein